MTVDPRDTPRSDRVPFEPRARATDALFAVGDEPRTWADLLADAEAVASAMGSGSSEVVVACGDRYHGAVALLAIWRAGRVAALPPALRTDAIDALAAARGISLIVHDGGGRDGCGAGGRALDVRGLLGRGGRQGAAPTFAPDSTLACLYTSGSTGSPIACLKTARQLLGEAEMLVRLFQLGPSSRVLTTVPPHHIYGLLFGTLVPFMGGGALVRATPLHAATIAAVAQAHGADVLCSVPAHLRAVAELPAGTLPVLRRIFSSAAPLEPALAARVAAVAGREVTEIFGSSETGGMAFREGRADPGWTALPGVTVEAETDGTMLVTSPFVNGPPRHRTDDRIRPLANGRFEFLGRGDGIVKVAGTRVSKAEVEALLSAIPGVSDAAVLSVEVGGARGHVLWAAVATTSLTVAALRAELRRSVDAVAVPRRFRLVEALPREPNGKMSRAGLEALFASPASGRRSVEVPADWSFFRGHFDGFPILAGVVQMTEIVLPGVRERWPALRHPRRITGLKFRSPILPGEALVLELALVDPSKVSFALHRRDQVVSSGTLDFAAASAGAP